MSLAKFGVALSEGLTLNSFKRILHRVSLLLGLHHNHELEDLLEEYEDYANSKVSQYKVQDVASISLPLRGDDALGQDFYEPSVGTAIILRSGWLVGKSSCAAKDTSAVQPSLYNRLHEGIIYGPDLGWRR